MEALQGHSPRCPVNSGAIGSEVRFHHYCSSRQIFGGAKDLFPNFPKHARKGFCATFAYKISPTKIIMTFFWCDLQKRSSCVFLQTLGAIFEVKQLLVKFLPRFSANQTFWGCACTHCTPTSNTTAFHKSIIGNFVVYQDRLEINLLQLFGHLENSE